MIASRDSVILIITALVVAQTSPRFSEGGGEMMVKHLAGA